MTLKLPKNKWFYAFLIAAVLAIAGTVVAIVIGVTSASVPDYTEGEEVGIYYYDTADGEVLLTLSGGNKFSLAGPTTNKTGSYTVDGTTITLDFIKDEDGTATATINGDTLRLEYDNATLPFLKKVNYTVTFDGADLAAVTVVNGKNVAKPEDPVKENSVFLGWYSDAAFKTAFDFENTAVTTNLIIYAKWVDRTVGVPEYTVDFDLGYDGAELTSLVTVSGKAYGVTTPERDGYTFGGWYVSMYENGEKLTYAYTEDTVFTADTTLFAVWYDDDATALKAPSVSVSENEISWVADPKAASYKLTVIAPDGTVLIDNETVGGTTKEFNFADYAEGEYKISVIAVASNAANNSPAADRYYANKALNRVSSFFVEDGILVFGAVENAEKYLITVDCGNNNHAHTAFDNGSRTVFDISNCSMQKGGIKITVTAVANGFASSVSKVFVYEKNLAKIDDVVYNTESDTVVWDAVPGAAGYTVTVTVGSDVYTYENGTFTSFSVAGYTGEFTVSVVPVAEGYNSPEKTTASINKTNPAAPSGLTVNGNVISWNAVEGAASYELYIGGNTFVANTNSFDISTVTLNLNQGSVYTVKVKAVNAAGESSSYSAPVSLGYYVLDKVVKYSANTVYWSPVLGVNNYQVRVNGGEVINVTDKTYANVVLTREGENIIEVRYVQGEDISDWVSVSVYAYAVEYDTRSFGFGSFYTEYLAVGDTMSLPTEGFSITGYHFTGWYNTPKGAAGNGKLFADGAIFTGNSYTVVYAEWTPNNYNINLELGDFDVVNMENGTVVQVTYKQNFTLPVPETNSPDTFIFNGWRTGPFGGGIQLTDDKGNSLAPFEFTQDITLYADFTSGAVEFVLREDNLSYEVKKGPAIETISSVTIPMMYKGLPVTHIVEYGFQTSKTLVKINIPDTIKSVGVGAFNGCTLLESINVYEARPGEIYEKIYSSDNGVLIKNETDGVYIEMVPRAMTGSYTVPEYVNKILPKAFDHTSITSVTIGDNIERLVDNTFYYCSVLETITIEGGRTAPIELDPKAFNYCSKVTTVNLPADVNTPYDTLAKFLDSLSRLKAINIGSETEKGVNYSSIGGILTNSAEDTILYCPKGFSGDFTVPQGIKTISANAFKSRYGIDSLTVPYWVTEIGDQAFYSCQLSKITFNADRTEPLTIGKEAFAKATEGLEVFFNGSGTDTPDTGAVTIGESAFASSSYLSKVVFGKGANVAKIGKNAFQNCGRLSSLEIDPGAKISVIGESAFEGCAKIGSVYIPASVTSIEAKAFSGCSVLTEVIFGTEGATEISIADYVFSNCVKLPSITLPDHLNEFNSSSFDGCTALRQLLVNTTNTKYVNDSNGILYKKGEEGGAVVLEELLFYPTGLVREKNGVINDLPDTLKAIGGAAFSDNNHLITVTIPKSVTSIGGSAFANCANLTHLTFDPAGTSLTIGTAAFKGCPALSASFELPAYTTSIGDEAFYGSGLTSFTVPRDVTSIGKACFGSCPVLETIVFECTGDVDLAYKTATSAKTGVFANSPALKSVKFPASMTVLSKYAFYQCYALETVEFGTVTKTVKDGVTVYTTDSQLKTIGNYAFQRCTSLHTIVIPKTTTAIGSYAFQCQSANPGSLKNIIFELGGTEKLNIASSAFQYQKELVSITFPARISLWTNNSSSTNDGAGNKIQNPVTTSFTKLSQLKTMFTGSTALAELNVAVEDGVTPMFSSLDGVLYNGDKSVLIYCPFANVGAYKNGTPTYEIVVPTSVQLVFTYAFSENSKLKTVTFAEFDKADAKYDTRLLTIGNYPTASGNSYGAIGGTTSSITTINLPSHIAKINAAAFACGNQPDAESVAINFNSDTTSVELYKYAFAFCRAESITLPAITLNATASNQTNLFRAASRLTTLNITFPEGLTKLPDFTFMSCAKLTGFELPAQFTEIGKQAFEECVSLTAIDLENVTKIGERAFQGAGIITLTIPAAIGPNNLGMTEDYDTGEEVCNVFKEMPNLTTVIFELDGNGNSKFTTIPASMFEKCRKLTNINLNDLKLEEIGALAFDTCLGLGDDDIDFTKMTDLYFIGDEAFRQTALVNVDLSNTQVEEITSAFTVIKTLKFLALPKVATMLATNFYRSCSNLEEIVLPEELPAAQFTKLADYRGKVTIPAECTSFVTDSYGVIYDTSYQTVYFAPRNVDLTNYEMPSTVLLIAEKAFYKTKLGALTIPDGVTEIGKYAFAYSDITAISIPSSVKKIQNYAFRSSDIALVEWRDEKNSQLTNINAYAFMGTKLVEFTVPDSVTTLATYVFKDCVELKTLILGGNVKKCLKGLLEGCVSLETFVMQENLQSIAYLFDSTDPTVNGGIVPTEYPKVTTVTIPSTVTTIDTDAFAFMGNLKEVIFAEGSKLTTIGKRAFSDCYALESINIPVGVETLSAEAFYNASALKSIDLSKLSITAIEPYTFYGASSLEEIALPGGLTSIKDHAFASSGLVTLNVPVSVVSIESSAFEDAAKLTTVSFPVSSPITELGSESEINIFKGTTNLETVTIPNAVSYIGEGMFENSGIKKILLADPTSPSEITEIANNAFANCTRLTEFAYLDIVTVIGDRAFYNCTSLSNTKPGEQLISLGAMAFAYCNNLSEGYIPSSVAELGGNPYAGLDKDKLVLGADNKSFQFVTDGGVLTIFDVDGYGIYGVFGATGEYTIDSAVKFIGAGTFAANAITSITIPAKFTQIPDYAFEGCTSLTEVNMSAGVTKIGNYAFYNTGIEELVIPAGVTTLGDYSFADNKKLTSVFVPKSVTAIGKYGFAYNSLLSEVVFEEDNSSCTLDTHLFYNCSSMTEVALPTGSLYITEEEAKAQVGSHIPFAWNWDMLPSYTFAGTGIVHAVLPESVKSLIGYGVFENCKELVDITLEGAFNSNYDMKANCFAGCDKFTYKVYMSGIETDLASEVVVLSKAGIKELHYTQGVRTGETEFILPGSYFDDASESFNIYFDNSTYEEIAYEFRFLTSKWDCNIYDKDGNKLICHESYGTVGTVVNADGEVIWTNPDPVPLPAPNSSI